MKNRYAVDGQLQRVVGLEMPLCKSGPAYNQHLFILPDSLRSHERRLLALAAVPGALQSRSRCIYGITSFLRCD